MFSLSYSSDYSVLLLYLFIRGQTIIDFEVLEFTPFLPEGLFWPLNWKFYSCHYFVLQQIYLSHVLSTTVTFREFAPCTYYKISGYIEALCGRSHDWKRRKGRDFFPYVRVMDLRGTPGSRPPGWWGHQSDCIPLRIAIWAKSEFSEGNLGPPPPSGTTYKYPPPFEPRDQSWPPMSVLSSCSLLNTKKYTKRSKNKHLLVSQFRL